MHGDLCKHLGTDSSTDHPDRFLNAYINRHVHAEYLKFLILLSFRHMACFPIEYSHQYLPLPVYEVAAIRVNTTKSTYTFTSVNFICYLI